MNQAQLTLIYKSGQSIESFVGLTDWRAGKPPMIGWWDTRSVRLPSQTVRGRRWWNGSRWSWMVMVSAHDDEEAKELMQRISTVTIYEVEYRGLAWEGPT